MLTCSLQGRNNKQTNGLHFTLESKFQRVSFENCNGFVFTNRTLNTEIFLFEIGFLVVRIGLENSYPIFITYKRLSL